MRFRIQGRDAHSGNPVQPVEVMADCEDSARELARRLGVRVESVEAIESTASESHDGPGELSDWFGRSLQWRVDAPGLLKLGDQHPHWGRRITTAVFRPGMLLVNRFGLLVGGSVALLAAIGVYMDAALVAVAWITLLLFLPLFCIKLVAFALLRRAHATGGFPAPRQLQLDQHGLHLRAGETEHHWPFDAVRTAYELPDFLLFFMADGAEIAVPGPVFDSRRQALEFARFATRAPGACLYEGYRSEAVVQRRPDQHSSAMSWFLGLACLGVLALVMWLHFRSS